MNVCQPTYCESRGGIRSSSAPAATCSVGVRGHRPVLEQRGVLRSYQLPGCIAGDRCRLAQIPDPWGVL
jgi:hypothetical protein